MQVDLGRRTVRRTFVGGLRWWEVAPEVLLTAGLGLFAATEPSAAASAFTSRTALGLMALAAVVWLGGRMLLHRLSCPPGLRLVVFGVAAAAVLAVVVLPAYRDTTVVETLPTLAAPAAAVVPTTTDSAVPATAATTPAATGPTTTRVGEQARPVSVRSGQLRGIGHRATGTAVVYRQADGSLLVGLENVDIQPGPDYDVFVVPGTGREDVDGGVRLDDLRGNKGTQYYVVPAGADVLSGPWTVLVWCQTFDVPVAGATPA